MTAPVGSLLAGVQVLDGLWAVEALNVDLHAATIFPDRYGPGVSVVEVRVHAADFAGAERAAARLGLAPVKQSVSHGDPTFLRRDWAGWAASAPGQALIFVEVVALELLADHATPTGPDARDGWRDMPLEDDSARGAVQAAA